MYYLSSKEDLRSSPNIAKNEIGHFSLVLNELTVNLLKTLLIFPYIIER